MALSLSFLLKGRRAFKAIEKVREGKRSLGVGRKKAGQENDQVVAKESVSMEMKVQLVAYPKDRAFAFTHIHTLKYIYTKHTCTRNNWRARSY